MSTKAKARKTCYNVTMRHISLGIHNEVLRDEYGDLIEDTELKPSIQPEIWNADPDCNHFYDPYQWNGFRCYLCGGSFCL